MMTTLEVLNAAASYLEKNAVESPRLNAEHLLAHVLGKKKRIDLYLEFERPLGEAERAPLRDLVKRRSEGVPLQHLLGTVEFLGREFDCDARALIPRPETEELVELVLKEAPTAQTFLDVGTGSGVIALGIALQRPEASVIACDISSEALALAEKNRARHALQHRVTLIASDLLAEIHGPFDVIVANLPYIPADDIAGLSREVRHDPLTALEGGPDGLGFIQRLAVEALPALNPGGLLALEIGHDQAGRVCALLQNLNYRNPAAHPDLQGVQRFLIERKP